MRLPDFGHVNPVVFHRFLYLSPYKLILTIRKLLILMRLAPRHGSEPLIHAVH